MTVERKMKDLDRMKKTIFDLKDANRKIAADFDDNRETLGIVKFHLIRNKSFIQFNFQISENGHFWWKIIYFIQILG